MNSFYIESIGICGLGMNNWEQAQAVFFGSCEPDLANKTGKPVISILPPNERRRTTKTIKIAINSIEQLMDQDQKDRLSLSSIFASSCGDVDLVQSICIALAQSGKPVSPTQFHNSVHNAAAGYWSIGNLCMQGTTSISAAYGTLAAALMESACQLQECGQAIVLCCYDIASPSPIDQIRHIRYDFACSFLLTPEPSPVTRAKLTIEPGVSTAVTTMDQSGLEALRRDNPAAAALPLLQGLALKKDSEIIISHMPDAGMRLILTCSQSW